MVQMARSHYEGYRWVQAPIAALSLWLMLSPFALHYSSAALAWSDVISGAAALVFAIAARKPNRGLLSWLGAAVGLWLLLAPLVFWAHEAVEYANDTLVGALLITFFFIVPMGMTMQGAALPPGWSYNPSAWAQRAPIIALGFVGFSIARCMTAYQLGILPSMWDPFFGHGTEAVLTSKVSRAWPVPDAGLGAVTYLLEVLMGFMGDGRRWRTMPWMVAGFGVIVVPLGIVSITLVILQPLAVGAWCSPCLATAAAMLFMIPLSLDEIVAMVQLLAKERREGQSLWRLFWLGTHLEGAADPPRVRPEAFRPRDMLLGVSSAPGLWLAAAAGVWLMFAPAVFGIGIQRAAADSDHLVGALVVVVSIIALAEVARPARFLNVGLGVWLLVAPWLLAGGTIASRCNSALAGLWVIGWSLPLGKIRERYGSYDRVVRWSPLGVATRRARPAH
jgi:hypothetical protein